jgi:hypothetical protein
MHGDCVSGKYTVTIFMAKVAMLGNRHCHENPESHICISRSPATQYRYVQTELVHNGNK